MTNHVKPIAAASVEPREQASETGVNRRLRTFAEFLETAPPDAPEEVCDRCVLAKRINFAFHEVAKPDLSLHCDQCGGIRSFYCPDEVPRVDKELLIFVHLRYLCRNCRRTSKTFSLVIKGEDPTGIVQKLGELPPYGPPTPSRVFKLIGEEYRELFLQGRRAEIRGLGIGAYAYYRRIVEHQKGRIIGEIRKVAEKLGAPPDMLKEFDEAISETQFSSAIEQVRAGFPQALLIDGHNPLKLLHNALSEGLHELTDAQCLELAESIRVILIDLAERIATTMKETVELKSAVARLLNRKGA